MAGIAGVLRKFQGQVLFYLSEFIGVRESKEVDILAILDAFDWVCIFSSRGQ